MTIKEFAQKVIESVGQDVEMEYKPMRETETSNFEPNLSRLEEFLGDLPKTALSDGIKKTIEWYKSNPN